MNSIQTISQSQINQFNECKRKYYLSHISDCPYPQLNTETDFTRKGQDFHRLVQQYIIGMDPDTLVSAAGDDDVKRWISSFCSSNITDNFDDIHPEITLSTIFDNIVFTGKMDAIAIKNNKITIFDWKTTKFPGKKSHYSSLPQTRLYLFLAKSAAGRLFGLDELSAADISMVYWFPEDPDKKTVIEYTEDQYQKSISWLKLVAAEMSKKDIDFYPQLSDAEKCVSCGYKSFCGRSACCQ